MPAGRERLLDPVHQKETDYGQEHEDGDHVTTLFPAASHLPAIRPAPSMAVSAAVQPL